MWDIVAEECTADECTYTCLVCVAVSVWLPTNVSVYKQDAYTLDGLDPEGEWEGGEGFKHGTMSTAHITAQHSAA